MKNSTKLLLASFIGVATLNLMSCSSSSGENNGPKPVPPGPTPQGITSLQVGQIGAIPTNLAVANASYPLVLFNNTKKVIDITSIKATGVDPRLNVTSDSQLFDAGSCKSIPAGGSCNIMMKASALRVNNIGENGQYGLEINGSSGSVAYKETQVVSYENFKGANPLGSYYNTSGATTTNITKPTAMAVTVPVYFDKAYNNVSLEAPGVSAALVGCGLISANGTYNISANSACSIVLDFRGGRPITSSIKLLANSSSVQKVTNSKKVNNSKSLTSGGNQILGFGFVNLPNSAALITTGFVTSSIPTDNTTTQTVTFVNNGMTTATQMNLTFADVSNGYSPTNIAGSQTVGLDLVTVTANTCTPQANGSGNGSLSVAGSCSVTFKINGNQQYGDLRLAMSYYTGIGTSNTGFNTYYYPTQSTATLTASVSPSVSEFNPINVGTQVKSMTVTLTNSGTSNITLSNTISTSTILKTAGQPGVPNGMTISSNTCTANTTVAANGSCSYVVTFDPTESSGGLITNLYGVINGTYTSLGNTYNISNSTNIVYNVIEPTDLTFNPTELQFTTNVGESVLVNMTITNTNTTPSAQPITDITFNWNTIGESFVTIQSQTPSGCLSSLATGNSCDVVFKYAPTSAESSNGYRLLPVNYNNPSNPTANSDDIPVAFQAINGNTNVQVTNVVASDLNGPPVIATGQGTSSQPYTFYNYGNNFGLTITYTNSGTVTADNFSIDGATLPATDSGWIVDTVNTTCAIGARGSNIAGGGTCELVLIGGNQNQQNVMTAANTMNFDFPVASYDESGQVLVRNVWNYNNQAGVYVTQNPILVPSYSIGNGVLESVGGQSYFVYPVTLANNANAGQTAPIPVAIDPTVFNLGNITAGLGSSNTSVPAGGAYTTTLAGGQSQTPLYLWVPYQSSMPTSSLYATWSYQSLQVTQSPGSVLVYGAPTGVMYTASGSTITPRWSGYGSTPFQTVASGAPTINTVNAPATITDMIQYQGYVYAMTAGGVYSYSINPWANNSGAMIPDATSGTGTGALSSISSGASQIDTIINDAPGAMSIATVAGTTYALVTEAGAQTTAGGDWPYTIATIANGVFANTVGTFTGLSDNTAITSVALSEAGKIYITTINAGIESAFSCQTTTQALATTAACSLLTLPSSITTAPANTTLNSLAVSAVGGQVAVTQVTSDPNASGVSTPATKYVFANDNGSSTDLANGTVNQVGGSGSSFINANPYTYYYNLDATATTATPIFGMSGQTVSTSGFSPYTHTASPGGYAYNLATSTQYGGTGNAFGNGINAYYSFVTVGGQN